MQWCSMSLTHVWLTYNFMHDVYRRSVRSAKKEETQLSASCMVNHSDHQSCIHYPGTLEIVWLICNECTHSGHRTIDNANRRRANPNQGGNHQTKFSRFLCFWLPFDGLTISCMMFAVNLVKPRSRQKLSWVHAAWWITIFTNHMFIILALWKLHDWFVMYARMLVTERAAKPTKAEQSRIKVEMTTPGLVVTHVFGYHLIDIRSHAWCLQRIWSTLEERKNTVECMLHDESQYSPITCLLSWHSGNCMIDL